VSIRITRRTRRVLDCLSRGPATVQEITEATALGFQTVLNILGSLADNGMTSADGRAWKITPEGVVARTQAVEAVKAAHVASWPGPRPRGPRPPYTRRTGR
jgi:DNA-binding IclR family transcriptional regulator